jgi:hypothetical protein
VVVSLPVRAFTNEVRTEREVSLFEKAQLAVLAQRYWADNSVSLTLTFDREKEGHQVGNLIRMVEGQLKSMSFLPIDPTAYPQMPYEALDTGEYSRIANGGFVGGGKKLERIDWDSLYAGAAYDAEGEKYCTTDVCEIKPVLVTSNGNGHKPGKELVLTDN